MDLLSHGLEPPEVFFDCSIQKVEIFENFEEVTEFVRDFIEKIDFDHVEVVVELQLLSEHPVLIAIRLEVQAVVFLHVHVWDLTEAIRHIGLELGECFLSHPLLLILAHDAKLLADVSKIARKVELADRLLVLRVPSWGRDVFFAFPETPEVIGYAGLLSLAVQYRSEVKTELAPLF